MYARFGRKEQSELPNERKQESMQKIAEESGYIQPKKKAWLLVLSPVKMYKESEVVKTDRLRKFAEEQGYEVIGQSEVSRRGKGLEETIIKLLEAEAPVNGADVLYIKGMRALTFDGYKKAMELYDKVTAKGIQFLSADGSLQMIKNNYDFYSKAFHEMDEFDLESKRTEQKENDFIPKM